MSAIHTPAPDAGRNVHCTCGAEYSLVTNLMRHINANKPATD